MWRRLGQASCSTWDAAAARAPWHSRARGAKVIGSTTQQISSRTRDRLAEDEDLRVELRHSDLADLAFLPPASVDVAYSGRRSTHVIDTGRVFRQVHRVLKTGAPFVFSVVHPAAPRPRSTGTPDRSRPSAPTARPSSSVRYTISDLYGGLQRAQLRGRHVARARSRPHTAPPRSCRRRSSCEAASSAS